MAAVPGRIGVFRGKLVIPASPEFGASRHLARAILTVMEYDPHVRAAANIAYNREVERALRSLGIKTSFFDRSKEPREVREREGATTPWGIREAIRNLGGEIPEAVIDYGGHGKEPLVILLGPDPVAVARRIVEIAGEASKRIVALG